MLILDYTPIVYFLRSFFKGKVPEKSFHSLLEGVPGHNGPWDPVGPTWSPMGPTSPPHDGTNDRKYGTTWVRIGSG